jgi:hypothetical protein
MSSGEDKCDKWDFNSKKTVIPTHTIIAEKDAQIAVARREVDELRTLFEAQQLELQAALGREERLRRALNGWQEWWAAPWEAKRPDIAQRRYEAGCAALQKEEMMMVDANELEEKS